MIDPNTGRKFTKISGQVWYDTLGVQPEERVRQSRQVAIDEQKYYVDAEKERKRNDELMYKTAAGDVSTWISGMEEQRRAHLSANYGAHLIHTNVTRDKVDLEVARKNNVNARIYHDELAQQLEEKSRETKLTKLKEDVAGFEHTKKWDNIVSIWIIYAQYNCKNVYQDKF